MYVCVCVRACVRVPTCVCACVRASVRVCVCERACSALRIVSTDKILRFINT